MTYFLTLLVNGISIGSVYALIAVGFVVVFKATRVLNFAHGSILLLGVVVLARLQDSIGFWLALLAGVAASAVFAALVYLIVMQRAEGAEEGTLAILTIGVDILLLTELTRQIGNDILAIDAPWGATIVEPFGLRLPLSRVVAIIVAPILLGLLGWLFERTDWGLAMRAAAADSSTASLMGVRLRNVGIAAWATAGGLAAVGGLFLASFPAAGVAPAIAISALAAIPAWVVGGFDSVPGAILGGLLIGVVSSLAAGYQADLTFLGRGIGSVAPWAVMVLVLLIRPDGLLGGRSTQRV
jgi:branched-chain amino acid transport system permease protein